MPSKLQFYSEFAERTARQITGSYRSWTAFLSTAARLYKYPYGDGLSWQYEKELEKRKSSVRCKVEYVFRIVKDIFHWRKTRYRGIYKNACHAHLLFASANLYMLTKG